MHYDTAANADEEIEAFNVGLDVWGGSCSDDLFSAGDSRPGTGLTLLISEGHSISYKDHVTNEEVRAKTQQAIGPHEHLLTIVKRRKLHWYGHVSRSSGLAKQFYKAQ